jgi:hypothetical protein
LHVQTRAVGRFRTVLHVQTRAFTDFRAVLRGLKTAAGWR